MNRKTKRHIQTCLCTLVFVCTACQSNETQQAGEVKDVDKNSLETSKNQMNSIPARISVDQQVEGATKDLATRTGVAVETITIKEARSVQWGSGALGCPEPGMNYTQALVPGTRLLLEADSTIYYYHGAKGKNLFFCPAERAKAPAYGPGTEVM